jgi:Ca2+-binding EF-hand superfamily protein
MIKTKSKIFFQASYPLSKNQLSDYKEVFQLFDKNQDGVLSFSELSQAMQTLGHRIAGVWGGGVLISLLFCPLRR